MQIRANSLLKFGVPVLALGVILLSLRACQDGGLIRTGANDKQDMAQLTQAQMDALGIEAESPQDTVSTLVAQMYKMQEQLAQTRQESIALRKQNKDLAQVNQGLEASLQQAISQALDQQREQYQQGRDSLVSMLTERIDGLRVTLGTNNDPSDAPQSDMAGQDMPVGLGLPGDVPAGAQGGLVWVDPLEVRAVAQRSGDAAGRGNSGVSAFKTAFDNGRDAVAQRMPGNLGAQAVAGGEPAAAATPVYTVPKNSTLTGSVSMSALLGRVPINGTVQNPYPFKIVIGAENLVANGIMLPELKGAVVSGTAIGDWTLSCVRGTVRSITFVFADGTSRVVPPSAKPGEDNQNKNSDGIGYISNPQGLPCVPGTRKTNARKFILTQMILSAGAAAAGAVAGGETTTSTSPLGSTTSVTGNTGRYIAGQALAQGVNDVRKWVKERFGQTFDAIYVPPGAPVVVNVTKTLPIDYQHNGRQVHYVYAQSEQGLE